MPSTPVRSTLAALALAGLTALAAPAAAEPGWEEAEFRGWHTDCRIDPMTDRRECVLDAGSGVPEETVSGIVAEGDGPAQVVVGGDLFPGSTQRARIDRLPAHEWEVEEEGSPPGLWEEMLRGTTGLFSFRAWGDDDGARMFSVSLAGFAEAVAHCRAWVGSAGPVVAGREA